MFRVIAAKDFAPFAPFRLELPPANGSRPDLAETHLLTGINGTGKTRLLSAIAGFLGNPESLIQRVAKRTPLTFTLENEHKTNADYPCEYTIQNQSVNWSSGTTIPNWAESVPAFFLSCQPYLKDAPIAVLSGVERPTRKRCLDSSPHEAQSKDLLQAIANLKIQSAMDQLNDSAQEAHANRASHIIGGLERAVSSITGQKFSFTVSTYPQPALLAQWGNHRLPVDVLPDGLRAILGSLAHAMVMLDAWLQGSGNLAETEVILLLDEIESHLHPAWQRKILPAFQQLFPKAQIFVSTHSPFVISSLNYGWIHSLKLGADGLVHFEKPQPASEGDSYVSVLEDIMGVTEWYDWETEQLLTQFRQQRDAAYQGDNQARQRALILAGTIARRSVELEGMMGREAKQLERQLHG